MTKDIETESEFLARGEEHRLRQSTVRAILNEDEWLTAELINTVQLSPPADKSQPAAEWKRGGLVFCVIHDGEERFPRYEFDAKFQPKPVISDILNALGPVADPWKIAAWFHFPNGWIANLQPGRDVATPVAPKDALDRPDDVVAAARKTRGTYVA